MNSIKIALTLTTLVVSPASLSRTGALYPTRPARTNIRAELRRVSSFCLGND